MTVDPISAIPHRPPILCPDRLVEADEDHAVAEHTARDDWEPWLIEALAQTTAVLNATVFDNPGTGMLVQVKHFKVARRPVAGERLTLRVDVAHRLPPLALVRGTVLAGDETVAEGDLKLYVEEREA
ncbi:MAG: hypothetical protein ACYTGN_07140 [Planctomycetota bacterium]